MDINDKSIQEGLSSLENGVININDLSPDEQVLDYSELIKETVFLGEVPYETINECLIEQFNDYINLEDKENYVDIFYDQLHASYEAIHSDESEEHPAEKIEILDTLHDKFVNDISDLFKLRLTITIIDLEDTNASSANRDEIEFIIRRLYEYFILDARNNFKVVIAKNVNKSMNTLIVDDNEYFRTLQAMLNNYSPLITCMTPTQFMEYRGDQEIIDLFEEGKVVGNFLRKYSPKLYANEEFQVELINYITMIQHFKEDVLNGRSESET